MLHGCGIERGANGLDHLVSRFSFLAGDFDLDEFVRLEGEIDFPQYGFGQTGIAHQHHRVQGVGPGAQETTLGGGEFEHGSGREKEAAVYPMKRSKTSKAWMTEHVNDPYVQQAKKLGYRSRAAFKLLEIDARDHLLKPGAVVVDLGAAPGGWSQVAAKKLGPRGRVIAVDVLDMAPLPGVEFIQGDFTEAGVLQALESRLAGAAADLVISDMAPNISGIGLSDQARSMHLAELAMDFALQWLKPDGVFLVKLFQGAGFEDFVRQARSRFRRVSLRKPGASRSRSREVYLLAREPVPAAEPAHDGNKWD